MKRYWLKVNLKLLVTQYLEDFKIRFNVEKPTPRISKGVRRYNGGWLTYQILLKIFGSYRVMNKRPQHLFTGY